MRSPRPMPWATFLPPTVPPQPLFALHLPHSPVEANSTFRGVECTYASHLSQCTALQEKFLFQLNHLKYICLTKITLYTHAMTRVLDSNLNSHGKITTTKHKRIIMKIQFGILASVLMIAVACDPANRDMQRSEAINDLENFRDSVERVVDNNANVDWAEIESEYDRLSARAEEAYTDASAEIRTELDNARAEVESDIEQWKRQSENLNAEADQRMDDLEEWWQTRTEDAGDAIDEAGDDIEEGYESTKEWIDEHWEDLKDGTRERWNELKEKMDRDNADNA